MPLDDDAQRHALLHAVTRRASLQTARIEYHDALADAIRTGVTIMELAKRLGIAPRYLAETIKAHNAGRCGCRKGERL